MTLWLLTWGLDGISHVSTSGLLYHDSRNHIRAFEALFYCDNWIILDLTRIKCNKSLGKWSTIDTWTLDFKCQIIMVKYHVSFNETFHVTDYQLGSHRWQVPATWSTWTRPSSMTQGLNLFCGNLWWEKIWKHVVFNMFQLNLVALSCSSCFFFCSESNSFIIAIYHDEFNETLLMTTSDFGHGQFVQCFSSNRKKSSNKQLTFFYCWWV